MMDAHKHSPTRRPAAASAAKVAADSRRSASSRSSAVKVKVAGYMPEDPKGVDTPKQKNNEVSVCRMNQTFMEPFKHGWRRELVYRRAPESDSHRAGRKRSDCYYYTPAGKKLRSSKEIQAFLETSSSPLSMGCFHLGGLLLGAGPPRETERQAGDQPPTALKPSSHNIPKLLQAKVVLERHSCQGNADTAKQKPNQAEKPANKKEQTLRKTKLAVKKREATMEASQLMSTKKRISAADVNNKRRRAAVLDNGSLVDSALRSALLGTSRQSDKPRANSRPRLKLMVKCGPAAPTITDIVPGTAPRRPPVWPVGRRLWQLLHVDALSGEGVVHEPPGRRLCRRYLDMVATAPFNLRPLPLAVGRTRHENVCSLFCFFTEMNPVPSMPTLQCLACCCLFHAVCVGMKACSVPGNFLCLDCHERLQPLYSRALAGSHQLRSTKVVIDLSDDDYDCVESTPPPLEEQSPPPPPPPLLLRRADLEHTPPEQRRGPPKLTRADGKPESGRRIRVMVKGSQPPPPPPPPQWAVSRPGWAPSGAPLQHSVFGHTVDHLDNVMAPPLPSETARARRLKVAVRRVPQAGAHVRRLPAGADPTSAVQSVLVSLPRSFAISPPTSQSGATLGGHDRSPVSDVLVRPSHSWSPPTRVAYVPAGEKPTSAAGEVAKRAAGWGVIRLPSSGVSGKPSWGVTRVLNCATRMRPGVTRCVPAAGAAPVPSPDVVRASSASEAGVSDTTRLSSLNMPHASSGSSRLRVRITSGDSRLAAGGVSSADGEPPAGGEARRLVVSRTSVGGLRVIRMETVRPAAARRGSMPTQVSVPAPVQRAPAPAQVPAQRAPSSTRLFSWVLPQTAGTPAPAASTGERLQVLPSQAQLHVNKDGPPIIRVKVISTAVSSGDQLCAESDRAPPAKRQRIRSVDRQVPKAIPLKEPDVRRLGLRSSKSKPFERFGNTPIVKKRSWKTHDE